MVQRRPWAAVAKLNGGEVDGMEIHVVLAHELVQINILRIEPPLLPLGSIVRRYARITNRRVKLESILNRSEDSN